METIDDMSRENLLIVVRAQMMRISELEKEISLYQKIIEQIKNKGVDDVK